jgi:hypothetical protein
MSSEAACKFPGNKPLAYFATCQATLYTNHFQLLKHQISLHFEVAATCLELFRNTSNLSLNAMNAAVY